MTYYHFQTARGGLAIRSYDAKAQRTWGRWLLTLLAAFLLALSLYPSEAKAYSPGLAAERREAVRSVILTRNCMFDATQAMLRQGVRQRKVLEVFAAASCGGQMRAFLVGIAGWSRADAEALVMEMAVKEVASAMSWGK